MNKSGDLTGSKVISETKKKTYLGKDVIDIIQSQWNGEISAEANIQNRLSALAEASNMNDGLFYFADRLRKVKHFMIFLYKTETIIFL